MLRIDYQPKIIPILILHHLMKHKEVFFSVKDIQKQINGLLFAGQVERRAVYFVLKNSVEIGFPIEVETRRNNEKFYRWAEDQCTANAHMQD